MKKFKNLLFIISIVMAVLSGLAFAEICVTGSDGRIYCGNRIEPPAGEPVPVNEPQEPPIVRPESPAPVPNPIPAPGPVIVPAPPNPQNCNCLPGCIHGGYVSGPDGTINIIDNNFQNNAHGAQVVPERPSYFNAQWRRHVPSNIFSPLFNRASNDRRSGERFGSLSATILRALWERGLVK